MIIESKYDNNRMDFGASVVVKTKIAKIDTLIRMYAQELERNPFDKRNEE